MTQREKTVSKSLSTLAGVMCMSVLAVAAAAQTPAVGTPPPPPAPTFVTPPADYVIGAGDALSVKFYKDDLMSADVIVRPDGKITLPVVNEVVAAGLTPEQLRIKVTEASAATVKDPNVQIYVREIKSRQVFITGGIARPNSYPLLGPKTVLQLITEAGGLVDFADGKRIVIIRTENGKSVSFLFNYNDAMRGKNLNKNIELKPGDTVIVPN